MDITPLMEYKAHGLVKPLTLDALKLLRSPKLSAFADAISYMEANDCKAKQEARQALKDID